jgi:transposase-like protein
MKEQPMSDEKPMGQVCGAGPYERSQARQDTRAGSYERTLQTSAGEVNLKVPKLRRQIEFPSDGDASISGPRNDS